MPKPVDFYFDVGSPASYIAHKRLRQGFLGDCEVAWKPILLGGVMKATGNMPAEDFPAAKRAWMTRDYQRCAARDGIAFSWNNAFPINTLYLMRAVTGFAGRERYIVLVDALFDAMWARVLDLSLPEVRDAVLTDAGFDPAEIAALAADDAVKSRLKDATEAAVRRGVFGAPAFFVGEEIFFGQDRMDFVAEAARGKGA